MKPGAIVNVSRNQIETNNVLANDWYREDKWRRITEWMEQIENETQKSGNELAVLQTRRLRSMLTNIKNKEIYKAKEMPPYFIADLERFDRNWDSIIHNRTESRPRDLQEENLILREEIRKLEEMDRTIKYS